MKPLFTIHAGEYLVGSHIEQHYPRFNLWIPSKDTGIDLLVTNARNTLAVSLQVKFSKDFNPTQGSALVQRKLSAIGWWTHQEKKIQASKADLWVFVLPSFMDRRTHFIVLSPAELLRRLRVIHGRQQKRIQSYFWVTQSRRCWEARGLKKVEQELIAFDRFEDRQRDFTQFLDDWSEMEDRLRS